MELTRINLEGVRHIHLMGIGGAGMSGLALLLKELGYDVSGCDMSYSFYVQKLEEADIDFVLNHDSNHLSRFSPDLVVYSSAIPEHNKELVAALNDEIPVARRAQVLSAIFDARYGVGVVGTHGKTTTSSMISLVAEVAGLDPTVAIGGELCDIGCNAKLGSGPHMVAELDESDGSFLAFHPNIAVFTNIDWDHVNHYSNLESVLESFEDFTSNVTPEGTMIFCADDQGVRTLMERLSPSVMSRVITYGRSRNCDWSAVDLEYHRGGGVSYSVRKGENIVGRLSLSVSGDHNVLNSLATCIVADKMGISFEHVQKALGQFKGAKRRMQFKGATECIDVYDDYAHHPTELEATLKTVSQCFPDRKVLAIFQPHRYTRTRALAPLFAEALSLADKVVILPIYGADEVPIEGVSSDLILEGLHKKAHPFCIGLEADDDLINADKIVKMVSEGDVVITLGAGDVEKMGDLLLERIRNGEVPSSSAVVNI